MALPENVAAQPWPPVALRDVYRGYEVHSAWYAGNEDELSALYATNRLYQSGGIWAQAKRFFWGTPTPTNTNQRPVKLHVPLPAEVARLSANLIYAELPTIQFGDMDHDADDAGLTRDTAKTVTARVGELVDDRVHAQLLEGAELASALGGNYWRVVWDKAVDPDRPFIQAVAPDAAVPTFRWGRLASVIFWSDLPPNDADPGHWRLLEDHTPGRIEWGLYKADTALTLGRRMPLDQHPDAEQLASVVDQGSGVDTGSELLTAVYVPNVRPNRRHRKNPVATPLGRSDFDGIEDCFDSYDEVATSLMRDVRLGRARVFASRDLLESRGAGNGATVDLDREVFVPLKDMPGSNNPNAKTGQSGGLLVPQQFALRVKDHVDALTYWLEQAIRGAGYSVQTFGEATEVATTATEVNSREKLTVLTRGAKIIYNRPELQHLIMALLDVDQHVFGGPGRGQARPDIDFADAAADAPQVLAHTLQLLTLAEAASAKTKVEMLHPDWSDEQIDAEVEQIKSDYSELPDPTMAHLWAATAATGSITGGVPFKSATGVQLPSNEAPPKPEVQAVKTDDKPGQ